MYCCSSLLQAIIVLPPTSCVLQDRLGLSENCFCMDIPMGCCGCMYAITVAGNLLTAGNVKRALLP